MERNLIEIFNVLDNGDSLKRNNARADFPDKWLQIGGNHETRWGFRSGPLESPAVEIRNTTAIRAGIIQTQEASLDVGGNEAWLMKMSLKSGMPEAQAYLRIYPISSNGDIASPWEFSFNPGAEPDLFKQVISTSSDILRLRLETGVLGPGHLFIYQLIAYPLSPNRLKKRVKQVKKIRPVSHIQTIGEIIKPIQLAMPIPLKMPVTVQANVNADLRNLIPTRDKVQVCGSSMLPLATSSSGRAQVEIFGHGFYESLEEVAANQTMSATTIRDVSSLPRFAFAVYNFGTLPAYVQGELSPDGIHWAADGEQREVSPEKLVIVSPVGFLRYTRVSYWAEGLTTLRIWVQAQN